VILPLTFIKERAFPEKKPKRVNFLTEFEDIIDLVAGHRGRNTVVSSIVQRALAHLSGAQPCSSGISSHFRNHPNSTRVKL